MNEELKIIEDMVRANIAYHKARPHTFTEEEINSEEATKFNDAFYVAIDYLKSKGIEISFDV